MRYHEYLKETVDMSDPIPSDDEKLRSNSEILNAYGKGKVFTIQNNNNIIRVINIVKSHVDKNSKIIYDMSYDIKNEDEEVEFTLQSDIYNNNKDKTIALYQSEQLIQLIITAIKQEFNKINILYTIDDSADRITSTIYIKDPEKEQYLSRKL